MRDARRNVARARAARVTRGGLLDAADMVQGELNRSALAPGAAAETFCEVIFYFYFYSSEQNWSQHVSGAFKRVGSCVHLCR